jgi:hypothetical protein
VDVHACPLGTQAAVVVVLVVLVVVLVVLVVVEVVLVVEDVVLVVLVVVGGTQTVPWQVPGPLDGLSHFAPGVTEVTQAPSMQETLRQTGAGPQSVLSRHSQ